MSDEKKPNDVFPLGVNQWDHIDDVLPIIEKARQGKWAWFANTQCKYIELRIDMRDGGCILRDRDGNRISPEKFAQQYNDLANSPWPKRDV